MQVYLRKDNIIAYIQNYAKMRLESMYNFQLDFLLAILGFMPREGDWLDIEYSVEQGSPKITVHSVKATQRRQLEEVIGFHIVWLLTNFLC